MTSEEEKKLIIEKTRELCRFVVSEIVAESVRAVVAREIAHHTGEAYVPVERTLNEVADRIVDKIDELCTEMDKKLYGQ